MTTRPNTTTRTSLAITAATRLWTWAPAMAAKKPNDQRLGD